MSNGESIIEVAKMLDEIDDKLHGMSRYLEYEYGDYIKTISQELRMNNVLEYMKLKGLTDINEAEEEYYQLKLKIFREEAL